ncbi:hypothetical protein [Streptomyces sp. NPDC005485]|uniref:hypothetical protein n=1 Tax=Streptomyces sp. NPDC005485 TaxID=3155591 RepID=UPI0033B80326
MSIAFPLRRRPSNNRPVWDEQPSAAWHAGRGAVLTLMVAAVLVPLWIVVVTAPARSPTG